MKQTGPECSEKGSESKRCRLPSLLTRTPGLRTLAAFRENPRLLFSHLFFGPNRHETHFQPQQPASQSHPRLSGPHGDEERTPSAGAPPRERPQAALSVIRALRFEARKRLTLPAEFQAVRTKGRRLSDEFFLVSVMRNQDGHPRLGLAIATRVFGTAVARNRIKRLIRESFRMNQYSLPAVDITFGARDAARKATPVELRASLERTWKTIAARTP